MKYLFRLTGLLICILGSVYACKPKKVASTLPASEHPISVCGSNVLTYTAHIKPLMDVYCVDCHHSSKKSGGIDLSTYELVKEEAGTRRFIGSIEHDMPFSPMPKKHGKLADSTILMVNCWIENGRKF